MQTDVLATPTTIVALGAGRMGRSIALAYALHRYSVTILDFKERSSKDFQQLQTDIYLELDQSLRSLVQLGMVPEHMQAEIAACIQVAPVAAAEQSLQHADLVYEGVPETLEAKKDALQRASKLAAKTTIIASTTSTMKVEELAQYVEHPERFLNAHWLNPAFLIPLVELSTHAQTRSVVFETVQNSLTGIGKVPVKCSGAGFIVPRLQALIMNEAARMVEEGVASAEQIDLATRYGLGFRFSAIGLLEFIDFGGTDILFYANQYLAQNLSAERYNCPEIIQHKMDTGQLGIKTGQGFFAYEQEQIEQARSQVLARHLGMLQHVGLAPSYQ